MAAYKRLGTNERIKIQSLLDVLQPFSKIAKELNGPLFKPQLVISTCAIFPCSSKKIGSAQPCLL